MPLHQKILVYKKFPGLLGQMGHFSPILHQSSILVQHAFFCWNFACKVHIIIIRHRKYERYWVFKSFLKDSLMYCTANLFCSFGYLPTVAVQSYFISNLFLFLDFQTWWSCAMSRQWDISIFQRRSVFMANHILVQFLAQSSISVYFETWDFDILFKFCMITGYQSTAKVN